MKNFICEHCESNENPQSEMWEELCAYCNEMMLVANLEMVRLQIELFEMGRQSA